MSDVNRFDCTSGDAQFCYGCYTMTREEYGEYVRFEDYETLRADRDRYSDMLDISQDCVRELRARIAAVPDVFDGWEITCGGAYKNGHYSVVKRIDGKGWNGSAILNDELVSVVDAVPLDTAIIQCNRHAASRPLSPTLRTLRSRVMTQQKEHWFVMDGRAVYDTDAACVIWSAGDKRPTAKQLRDFAGEDACLCVQRGDTIHFVEQIP